MTDLASLTARIRAEFPDLDFARARLEESGEDHQVVVLDAGWVFRFARPGRGREALAGPERALLAWLAPDVPFAIPFFERFSAAGDFVGYRYIAGRPLRPELYATLADRTREATLAAMAVFLTRVHAAPPATIAQADGAVAKEWTGAMWRKRWLAERRAPVARFAPTALVARADRFFDAFAAAAKPPREVVIHGDVSDDHMLLAPSGGALAGVIDFGDACLGDPAYDLTFFFAYGEAAMARVIELYDPLAADPLLATRARRSYVRFRIEQLRRSRPDAPTRMTEIERHLDALGID